MVVNRDNWLHDKGLDIFILQATKGEATKMADMPIKEKDFIVNVGSTVDSG